MQEGPAEDRERRIARPVQIPRRKRVSTESFQGTGCLKSLQQIFYLICRVHEDDIEKIYPFVLLQDCDCTDDTTWRQWVYDNLKPHRANFFDNSKLAGRT